MLIKSAQTTLPLFVIYKLLGRGCGYHGGYTLNNKGSK